VQATTLTQDLTVLVRFVMQSCGQDFFQAVGERDFSISQIRGLRLLGEAEVELSLKELGDRLTLSLPATSRAVDGLVQRGLVTRTEDSEDRRVKRVALTADGRALLAELVELRLAGIEELLSSLTDAQRARLLEALAPLMEHVR
jgi:DNA-binding MarR family transcriptional regulator